MDGGCACAVTADYSFLARAKLQNAKIAPVRYTAVTRNYGGAYGALEHYGG
jgi:hypothetical protein